MLEPVHSVAKVNTEVLISCTLSLY